MGLSAGVEMAELQAPVPEAWQGQPDAAVVRAEQVRMLFTQQPVAIATNVVIAALVAGVLAMDDGWARPLVWMGCTLAVSIIRWLLWCRVGKPDPGRTGLSWARLGVGGAAAAAALWGVGLALLFPDNLLAQMIRLAVGGMCAGAAAALSSYRPAFYSFLFPALLPIAVRLAAEGTAEYWAMSALVLVYAAGLSLVTQLGLPLRKACGCSWRRTRCFGRATACWRCSRAARPGAHRGSAEQQCATHH